MSRARVRIWDSDDDVCVASVSFGFIEWFCHVPTCHVRGHAVKLSVRNVAETVRSFVMCSKIPAALMPRYPKFQQQLDSFSSLRQFHAAFRLPDGSQAPEDKPAYPVMASASAEMLVNDILLPLHTFKKQSSLVGQSAPLAVGFVKALLPELDRSYQDDVKAAAPRVEAQATELQVPVEESDMPVSQEEAEALQKSWELEKAELRSTVAQDIMFRAKQVSRVSLQIHPAASGNSRTCMHVFCACFASSCPDLVLSRICFTSKAPR